MYEKNNLKKLGIGKLKEIGKKLKIKNLSKMRLSDKNKLINQILNTQESKKVSKSPKQKARSRKKSISIKDIEINGKNIKNNTVKELKSYIKSNRWKGSSGLKKDDLIKFIKTKINKLSNKSPSPKRSKSPKKFSKSPKQNFPDETVWGKMKKSELSDLLQKYGVEEGLSGMKKKELKKLLTYKRCFPEKGEYCEDGNTCDVRNNVCMPPEFDKKNLVKISIGNKQIIGKKDEIERLKNILDQQNEVIDNIEEDEVIDNVEEDDIELIDNIEEDSINDLVSGMENMELKDKNKNVDDLVSGIENMELKDKNKNIDDLVSGMENMELKDKNKNVDDLISGMENMELKDEVYDSISILNQIEENPDENLSSILEVQKKLLDCMGLL